MVMAKLFKTRSRKAGLPPGSLVHVGERKPGDVECRVIRYARRLFEERRTGLQEVAAGGIKKGNVQWIDIEGLHEVPMLGELGKSFGIHALVLEDILQTGQRPKVEDLGDSLFIVLRMLRYQVATGVVEEEQVTLVLREQLVLSFQEGLEGDVFEPIRERIRKDKGQLRSLGVDFLAYSLMDAIVDQYFVILESLGDRIEVLEKQLLDNPSKETLQELYRLKRELLAVRKAVWPLREVVSRLERGDSQLIRKGTKVYLRDLYDHTVEVIDTVENFRESLASLLDLYVSSISNRMNEVMKVLTMIATIFIPLTFIAGIYGMNFSGEASPWNMPELSWYWGYPAVLLAMVVIAVVMVIQFKRKRWI